MDLPPPHILVPSPTHVKLEQKLHFDVTSSLKCPDRLKKASDRDWAGPTNLISLIQIGALSIRQFSSNRSRRSLRKLLFPSLWLLSGELPPLKEKHSSTFPGQQKCASSLSVEDSGGYSEEPCDETFRLLIQVSICSASTSNSSSVKWEGFIFCVKCTYVYITCKINCLLQTEDLKIPLLCCWVTQFIHQIIHFPVQS